jgi:hypothetical protein
LPASLCPDGLDCAGDERTEEQLASVMGSYEFGTPASRVTRLSALGYQVQFRPSSLDELQSHLDRGLFPIVFVRADLLPWESFGTVSRHSAGQSHQD